MTSLTGYTSNPAVGALALPIEALENDTEFSFPSGMYGLVYEGARITSEDDRLTLKEGSLLVASRGLSRVAVKDFEVQGFDGAISITRGTSSVSVAAITSPAYIAQGERRMIVPIGMQWHAESGLASLNDGFASWVQTRTPAPLPRHFIERQLREHSTLQEGHRVLPPSRSSLSNTSVTDLFTIFPTSQQQRTKDRIEDLLSVVRYAIEHRDLALLKTILQEELDQTGIDSASYLLSQMEAGQMLLLEKLIAYEPLWMLTSLHPSYRDMAWALAAPEVSSESRLTRLFTTPFSLLSQHEVSDFFVERLALAFTSTDLTTSFVEHAAEVYIPLIQTLEEGGYPKRAHTLSSLIENVIADAPEQTEFLQEGLTTLRERSKVAIVAVAANDQAPIIKKQTEEVAEESYISPEQAELLAREMLQEAGALFSLHTDVESVGAHIVSVKRILFSTPTRDRECSFTLNIANKTVEDIEIDGNADFPFASSFEGFVEWIREK